MDRFDIPILIVSCVDARRPGVPSDRPAQQIDSGHRALAVRAATSAAAAFAAFTFAWIVVGIANTGDAFPQGPARILLPLPFAAPLVAAYLGWRGRSRRARILVGILALLSLAFWTLVRDGWWASELPPAPTLPNRPSP
jgi:hypothetical protein